MATRYVAGVVFAVAMMPLVAPYGSDSNLTKEEQEKVKAIREKYGAFHFIRDLDHLKEDYAHVAELHLDGSISRKEATFYFFRMHDFDDNGLLDGLELLAAMGHHETKKSGEPITFNERVEGVDFTLEYDKDQDGFLSYGEMQDLQSEAEKQEKAG